MLACADEEMLLLSVQESVKFVGPRIAPVAVPVEESAVLKLVDGVALL